MSSGFTPEKQLALKQLSEKGRSLTTQTLTPANKIFSLDSLTVNCDAAEDILQQCLDIFEERTSKDDSLTDTVKKEFKAAFINIRNVVRVIPKLSEDSALDKMLGSVDSLLTLADIDFELVKDDLIILKNLFIFYFNELKKESKSDAARHMLILWRNLTKPDFNKEHNERVAKEVMRYLPKFTEHHGLNSTGKTGTENNNQSSSTKSALDKLRSGG